MGQSTFANAQAPDVRNRRSSRSLAPLADAIPAHYVVRVGPTRGEQSFRPVAGTLGSRDMSQPKDSPILHGETSGTPGRSLSGWWWVFLWCWAGPWLSPLVVEFAALAASGRQPPAGQMLRTFGCFAALHIGSSWFRLVPSGRGVFLWLGFGSWILLEIGLAKATVGGPAVELGRSLVVTVLWGVSLHLGIRRLGLAAERRWVYVIVWLWVAASVAQTVGSMRGRNGGSALRAIPLWEPAARGPAERSSEVLWSVPGWGAVCVVPSKPGGALLLGVRNYPDSEPTSAFVAVLDANGKRLTPSEFVAAAAGHSRFAWLRTPGQSSPPVLEEQRKLKPTRVWIPHPDAWARFVEDGNLPAYLGY